MSIQALPQKTVRAIGSAQVLTDPASLVKELVDNAIDARATNISIEISTNTLDSVQVRDNGHGIAPADRELVCKRYCTSKIQEFGDLKSLGGRSLGFRGEALASAAELSSQISIITRVEGEDVAACLSVGQNGEVQRQERASHPIGTTIKILGFLNTFPVRKQHALKQSTKCLAKMRHQLQAFALSHPSTRLSLRLLKAKNDKTNWTYAAKPGAGVEDAALKIFGKDCSSQCTRSTLEIDGFIIEAFLPKPDANVRKISNVGAFISVDSRPVSATRGTLNQIVKLFKERLKTALVNSEGLKDPLLCMNIVCPPESYDPNVEPAKDDVLFENSTKIVEAVGQLFDTCYAIPEKAASTDDISDAINTNGNSDTQSFRGGPGGLDPTKQLIPTSNMYGYEEYDEGALEEAERANTEQYLDEEPNATRVTSISNPWVIAKMNAPLRRPGHASKGHNRLLASPRHSSPPKVNSKFPELETESPEVEQPMLLTPLPSSSPIRASKQHQGYVSTPETVDSRSEIGLLCARRMQQQRANDFVSARELPLGTPFSAIPPARVPGQVDHHVRRQRGHPSPDQVDDNDTPEPTPINGTPLSAIPETLKPRRQSTLKPRFKFTNKPFIPPIRDPNVVWFEHLSPPKQSSSQSSDIRPFFSSGLRPMQSVENQVGDIASVNRAQHSPAIHRFFEAQGSNTDPETGLLHHEPSHKQAVRRSNQPTSLPRLHRTRSSLLPLERVSSSQQIQNCVLHLPISISTIRTQMAWLSAGGKEDYGYRAEPLFGGLLDVAAEAELRVWMGKLGEMLGEGCEVEWKEAVRLEGATAATGGEAEGLEGATAATGGEADE